MFPDTGTVINRGWNSVALFFNLVAARRPGDYRETTAADARNRLDEGDREDMDDARDDFRGEEEDLQQEPDDNALR